ncbi:transposase [Streptococcus pneumoniae]|nr:transposase [Streptococcus pneumoniae]
MSRVRVQIMNQLDQKSHEYKAIKRYWKLIQQDSRKLSDKRFYRPTFRMHLTNKEILNKLLSYSQDLKHHSDLLRTILSPNHSYLSQLDVTYKTPDLMSHFLPPHEVSFTFCCSSIVFPR